MLRRLALMLLVVAHLAAQSAAAPHSHQDAGPRQLIECGPPHVHLAGGADCEHTHPCEAATADGLNAPCCLDGQGHSHQGSAVYLANDALSRSRGTAGEVLLLALAAAPLTMVVAAVDIGAPLLASIPADVPPPGNSLYLTLRTLRI